MRELQTILQIFLVLHYVPDAQCLVSADCVQLLALVLLIFIMSDINHRVLILLGCVRAC